MNNEIRYDKSQNNSIGKVALFTESYPPNIDGVSNTVWNYSQILEKKYNGAYVVVPNIPNHKNSNSASPILEYKCIDTRKRYFYSFGIPFSPTVTKALNDDSVDILHAHSPFISTSFAWRFAKLYSLPLVLTYHTRYEMDQKDAHVTLPETWIVNNHVRHCINACDEVWTVGKVCEESLRSYGYRGDVFYMPNGIDMPQGKLSQSEISKLIDTSIIENGNPTLLFVGRMTKMKGVPTILEALAILKEKNIPHNMIMIGGGRDIEALKSMAQRLKLNDNCHFLGIISEREKLRAWYSRADLFLFPSEYDTNGLVVREAAAAETPSILIKDSSAADGIEEGISGFLTENNSAALAAKIEEVLKNPENLKKVGKGAQDNLYFSWEEAVDLAYERYAVVKENFKKRDPEKIRDQRNHLFAAQAKLMDGISKII